MGICSRLRVFYKGTNVMSKETTLVMYSKVKYFIQYYSSLMYRLLDMLCFLPEVWDLGPFLGLDSCPLSLPGPRVPFSQGAEFLSVPTQRQEQLNGSSWKTVGSAYTMVIVLSSQDQQHCIKERNLLLLEVQWERRFTVTNVGQPTLGAKGLGSSQEAQASESSHKYIQLYV